MAQTELTDVQVGNIIARAYESGNLRIHDDSPKAQQIRGEYKGIQIYLSRIPLGTERFRYWCQVTVPSDVRGENGFENTAFEEFEERKFGVEAVSGIPAFYEHFEGRLIGDKRAEVQRGHRERSQNEEFIERKGLGVAKILEILAQE